MTFARVTDHRSVDEHGPLYATREGVSTGTFPRSVCEIATLTGFATDEYDAREMPSEPEGTMVSDSDPSAAGGAGRPPQRRRVRCPTCGLTTSWNDNPERPFCSRTCRLVDLGVWLGEGYIVRGDSPDDVP